MLKLKPDVRFTDPLQALPIIALIVERVFDSYGYAAVITAAGDGRHKVDSFHYRGLALDFRTQHVSDHEHKAAIVRLLKDELPQCDVLFEGAGTPNEHLHVEWDPKG